MDHRPGHPLPARVMVNRLWQWHFGEGLAASENDFGVMGQRPSHPELLDYLAAEMLRSGGSIKHLQRLIVNSAAFRLSSDWTAQNSKDPDNRWLSRWKPRRLDSRRRAGLHVGGKREIEFEDGRAEHLPQAFASRLGRAVAPGRRLGDFGRMKKPRAAASTFLSSAVSRCPNLKCSTPR